MNIGLMLSLSLFEYTYRAKIKALRTSPSNITALYIVLNFVISGLYPDITDIQYTHLLKDLGDNPIMKRFQNLFLAKSRQNAEMVWI